MARPGAKMPSSLVTRTRRVTISVSEVRRFERLGCLFLDLDARRAGVFGQPAGDHVLDAFADIDGMIAETFVVPSHQGQLHRALQRHDAAVVLLDERYHEVSLERIETVVHVVERGGERYVAFGIGI